MAKKKDEITIRSSAAEYLTYVASVGDQQDSIEMCYEDENIWLTQKMMATLYDVGLPTINEHIKKIYADSELEEAATIRNFRMVQTEGSRQVTRDTKHYNLQMIIAVGFKVNSVRVKESFIRRSPTYMPQPLIMIKILQRREDFMRQSRIRCITQFMDIQQLSCSWKELITQKSIWG